MKRVHAVTHLVLSLYVLHSESERVGARDRRGQTGHCGGGACLACHVEPCHQPCVVTPYLQRDFLENRLHNNEGTATRAAASSQALKASGGHGGISSYKAVPLHSAGATTQQLDLCCLPLL